jgi:hypothetical protein
VNINVKYTVTFEKQFKRYKKKFDLITADLLTFLSNLENEPNVNLGGGFYKYRLAVKSKNAGKSGGFRVITFEVIISETEKNATLITIFDKSEKENIPTTTLKSILAQEGLV